MNEIDDMLLALEKIKSFLLTQRGEQRPEVTIQSIPVPTPPTNQDGFDKLKILVQSEEWPAAVNPSLIVDDAEENKIERAEGILDFLVDRSVASKKFLDFGCGEGHIVKVAAKMGAVKSIGYDIVPTGELWKELDENGQKDGYTLTTDFEVVKKNGPYDIILAFDSIEHADNMEDVLAKIKSMASPHASIYLSFQPWIGRYGGVLYKDMNKAFIHAVFSDEELFKLGLKPKWKRKVLFPLNTYRDLIKRVGLTIISERVEREPVEGFFEKHAIIRERLINGMPEGYRNKFPRTQMEQCSVEYVLSL